MEDIGITLGQAVAQAVGDKKGIMRYGHAYVPLDEALSRVVIDFSGRPGLEFNVPFTRAAVGGFDVDLFLEFFQGFVNHALVTLHVDNLRGDNSHHQAETVFKAFGRALRMALTADPRMAGVTPSTKGVLVGRCSMSGVVAVIDYGMGNLHSVASALEHVGADKVLVTHDAELIRQADRVVFPGVGAIRDCMAEIRRLHCDQLLVDALTEQHKPVLAICVGMQALMTHSEENGGVDCLDIIPGEVRYFGNPLVDAQGQRLKVPHMGWNEVRQVRRTPVARYSRYDPLLFRAQLLRGRGRSRLAGGHGAVWGQADAALARDNLFAVQFHPEKSHTAGLQLLRNFLEWNGQC